MKRIMKHIWGIFFWGILIMSLHGATVFAEESVEQTGDGKTIGVAHFWLGNDWNNNVQDGYTEYLEARGYKVTSTNAMNSTEQQITDIENFISSGVDGIIIAGGEQDAFYTVAKQAIDAGIPVVCCDMVVPGNITSASADNYTGGAALGVFVAKHLRGEGKVFFLTATWKSMLIRETMIKAVLADFDIEIVEESETGADTINEAYAITKSVLQANPDLGAVISTWGLPAIGAAQAIREMGLQDQVMIVCADCDMSILEEMGREDAPLWATIGVNAAIFGERAAEAIDIAVNDGDVSEIDYVQYGPTYIATNAPDIEDAFGSFVYVDVKTMWTEAYGEEENPF